MFSPSPCPKGCGRLVYPSDTKCPGCSTPLAQPDTTPTSLSEPPKPTPLRADCPADDRRISQKASQRTAKSVKVHLLLSYVTLKIGAFICLLSLIELGMKQTYYSACLGLGVVLVGGVWRMWAKTMKWWHHD